MSNYSTLRSNGGGVTLLLFGAVAVLSGLDIATDLREGSTLAHVLVEAAVLVLGSVGAALAARQLFSSLRAARAHAADLESRLVESRAEAVRWRDQTEHLMRGLGAAIQEQFARWQLTPAEAETALLMLKGLAHKEIASVRGVGVGSARQQARSVYRKAGLTGRHELIAFFLEDLLLPMAAPK